MSEITNELEALREAIGQSAANVNCLLGMMEPKESTTILLAMIGVWCGHYTDQEWSIAMNTAFTPCGVPECDCHLGKGFAMQAFDKIRDRYIKLEIERKKEHAEAVARQVAADMKGDK